jgi:3-oxoacyl-[acyl-carrier protein] reductase
MGKGVTGMLLHNQVAIVTGASRGIGRAIALTLAVQGASLVINGNRADLLQAVAAEIEQLGQRCRVNIGDVSNPETAVSLAALAIQEFGRIDVLVNNAGINLRSSTLAMKFADWQRVLDVDLNGTLHCCQAVLPHMIDRRCGRIVNISSTTAKTPHHNAAPAYGAAKAGVNYLTQHLGLEMAKHGIRVNAVCPGPIETDMSTQWTEEYRRQVQARVPLGRLGTPQDVANAVVFLASAMSDFITGETININGGTYMN